MPLNSDASSLPVEAVSLPTMETIPSPLAEVAYPLPVEAASSPLVAEAHNSSLRG